MANEAIFSGNHHNDFFLTKSKQKAQSDYLCIEISK